MLCISPPTRRFSAPPPARMRDAGYFDRSKEVRGEPQDIHRCGCDRQLRSRRMRALRQVRQRARVRLRRRQVALDQSRRCDPGGSDLASRPVPVGSTTRRVRGVDARFCPERIGSDTLGGVTSDLITRAREAAGLSKAELAERAGTSRPTLSAYEHGRVSPTLETAERILAAAGQRLTLTPIIHWRHVPVARARRAAVPDRLPDLSIEWALRSVVLPLHLEWSRQDRTVDLASRRARARAYEVVLREGRPADIEAIIDGAMLVDLWDELVLPRRLRAAWQPLIDAARGSTAP